MKDKDTKILEETYDKVNETTYDDFKVREILKKLHNIEDEKQRYKLIWGWIKQGHIENFSEFYELIKRLTY